MLSEITIVGYPSTVGGANTEMLDQIKVWHKMGIKISIMPTREIDAIQKKIDLSQYGCEVYPVRSFENLKGKNCIAFCNDNALKYLLDIKKYAKTFTHVPCMCVPKEAEKRYQHLIDLWLFQTQINKDKTLQPLNKSKIQSMFFTPHFDTKQFPFLQTKHRISSKFSFGRLSRGDILKWNKDQMWIYDNFDSLRPKMCTCVGWKEKFEEKCGSIDRWYMSWYPQGKVDVNSFYRVCNVFCITTDTLENFPRTGFEAMSVGSVIVTNNRGGWKEQIKNGETGFLCDTKEEFVEVMTELAAKPWLEHKIRVQAYENVISNYNIISSAKSWEKVFNKIESIAKKK